MLAYSNILRSDLNTTCITINRGVWRHGRGTNQQGSKEHGSFWNKPSVKVEIKTTWEVISTCEVLWSARLNTSKVTGDRQEDRSSQWEATKRSVGLSTARVVGAHRDRYQRRWTVTDIAPASTTGVWDWTAEIKTVIDIATPHWRLKSSEDRTQKSTKLWALSCLHSLACEA